MKEKSVTFAKGKSKFLQNHQDGGGEGGGDCSVENLGLFFKVNVYSLSLSHGVVET